jgi:hypothetical protein
MSTDLKSDIPDTPPEVLARQAASRPLTAQTAELLGAKGHMDEAGRMTNEQTMRANKAAALARKSAELYAGGTPLKGLTPEQTAEIKGRDYKDAPKMNPELGDRTPAFVNWLWANKPEDAKVRYAYRDIWPDKLPASWPPKPKAPKQAKQPAPSTVTA